MLLFSHSSTSLVLDSKTVSVYIPNLITVSCKLYYILPKSRINRLQQIQNSVARAVVNGHKFTRTAPILNPLHWLKINERIEYRILSHLQTSLYTTQPPYLYDLISLQTPRNTRSSSVVTHARPPIDRP